MFSHINERITHSPLAASGYVRENTTGSNSSSGWGWVWVLLLVVSAFLLLVSFMFSEETSEEGESEHPESKLQTKNHQ
jgi:hypothetical protein